MALTDKEEKFCQEYVKRLNKTQAAIAAGYSKDSARVIGHENLTKPDIIARVKEIRLEIQEKLGVDEHSLLKELAALGYWSISDFIGAENSLKDLSKLSKAKLKPVVGVKTKETYTTVDGVTTREVTTEIKLADKRGPLTDLGRHLGIFEKDNQQSKPLVKLRIGYGKRNSE